MVYLKMFFLIKAVQYTRQVRLALLFRFVYCIFCKDVLYKQNTKFSELTGFCLQMPRTLPLAKLKNIPEITTL